MKANNSIIISCVQSNKSENNVWMVCIQGTKSGRNYCRNAYTAMKYAFILKQRTGCPISDNCLTRLSHEIKLKKAQKIQMAAESIAEKFSVNKTFEAADKADKQKSKRKRVVKSTKLGIADAIAHNKRTASE